MKRSLRERWGRLRDDPQLWEWLPAGIVGGISGGAGVAWLFWGWPNLLGSGACFALWVTLGAIMFIFACAAGVGLVFLTKWLVRILRRLRTPPALAMWEPVEPVAELDSGIISTPGCAMALYLPLICLCGAAALGLAVLAFWQVAAWRVILLIAAAIPLGMVMARSERSRHAPRANRTYPTGDERR
ncbi:MAG: hypothetical protein MUF84_19060 [Anaerolineae bacterium]|jgi:hypothetical protein|nr:hypothetical protein [Anaerolineae bacterium]